MQEEKPVRLNFPSLPKIVSELTHSNQFLKIFALAAFAIVILALLVVSFTIHRSPLVIPISPAGMIFELTNSPPKPEAEIEAAVIRYVDLRYHWDPKSVGSQLQAAQKFISSSALKTYQAATAPVLKFSSEKQVSQRAYPARPLAVDLAKKSVFIGGDRITEIQGLKAAGNLKLTLLFESGPRTPENPWGVYITQEKEEQ